MGSQIMELEESNLYESTKNGTRRKPFILVHKNGTRRHHFVSVHKKWNEKKPCYMGPQKGN